MPCALESLASDPVGGRRAAASRQPPGKHGSFRDFWNLRNGKTPWAKQELSTVITEAWLLWFKVPLVNICRSRIQSIVQEKNNSLCKTWPGASCQAIVSRFGRIWCFVQRNGKFWKIRFPLQCRSDGWHLAACALLCANLCASPSLPAAQAQHRSSRESWVCPGGSRSCVWISELQAAAGPKVCTHPCTGTLKMWAVMTETSGPGRISLESNSDFQPFLLSPFPVFNHSYYCWAFAHHVVKCFGG